MGELLARAVVTVANPQGIHARPADLIVKAARNFASQIELIKGTERVEVTSILAILTLAAEEGTPITIEARGSDAQAAVDAIAALFVQGFSEPHEAQSRPKD